MHVGIVFPNWEIGNDPALICGWAQEAERLGLRHIMVWDHVLGAVHEGRVPALDRPTDHRSPFHEPLVLCGFLAAATRSIELATGILIVSQRQTALVAKQIAEVDLLSGGRLRLGIGSGWNYVEYEALGVEWTTRGRRLDEQLELLELLWSRNVVEFDGEFHHLDRVAISPRPARRIPLWFGGYTEKAFRRAARHGDGLVLTPPDVRGLASHTIDRVRGYVAEAGRDPAGFGFDAIVWLQEGWREQLEMWRDAGVGIASIAVRGLASPEEHVAVLERVAAIAEDFGS